MNEKWVGAILVIAGCGGIGFSIAAGCRREERLLRNLMRVIEYMASELQYTVTPLPELCRHAGAEIGGVMGELFLNLARELDWQIAPDAYSCMAAAMKKSRDLPSSVRKLLLQLGKTLGQFDLPGQLKELDAICSACDRELNAVSQNQGTRLRSYQTLGLCAGAALAILFF